jgi:hypothetical protein
MGSTSASSKIPMNKDRGGPDPLRAPFLLGRQSIAWRQLASCPQN